MAVAVVSAGMQTLAHHRRSRSRHLGLVLVALFATTIGACSSAAAPPATSAPVSPPVSPIPTQDPGGSVGVDEPPTDDDPALIDPLGRIIVPKPGQLDVHAIPAQTLSATVAGRHVTVTIDYTSGVEPCNVLDSIVVAVGADAKTFAITLREGHGPQDVACIEIAQMKRSVVDLGDLAPGTYTISDAARGAAPITVTID
jgi:hypothetical protein